MMQIYGATVCFFCISVADIDANLNERLHFNFPAVFRADVLLSAVILHCRNVHMESK